MPIINCPDCKNEISDAAPTCPNCGRPNTIAPPVHAAVPATRKVGFGLGIGILLLPVLFSWFTLRKGHSTSARIFAFAYLLLSIVIFSMNGGKSNSSSTYTTTTSSSSVQEREAILQVNLHEILSAYKENEVGADNKYKDRLIEVTGIIGSIKKDITDNLYVTIGTGREFEIPQIQAFFDDSMNTQLGSLKKGAQLTVVCRVQGLMMNVLIKDCVIK